MTNEWQDRLPEVLQVINLLAQKAAGGDYLYRGEPRRYRRVESSLYRKYSRIEAEYFDVAVVQREILDEAKRFTRESDEDAILEQLQHFGYPTNQIDFTRDYFIALFFACDGKPDQNGRVILLDKTGRDDLKEPKAPENRIIAQRSVFVRPPEGFVKPDDIVVIPKSLKRPILEYLDKGHGISASTVFNDLHGFIKYRIAHDSAYGKFYSGLTQHNKGKYEKAIESYSKSIELNPEVSVSFTNRGICYMYIGNYEDAIQDFGRAIELSPSRAIPYYDRGYLYAKKGDHKAAIRDFSRAIDLDPKYADAYNNRGYALIKIGDYDRAIRDQNRAVELSPDSPTTHLGRGFTHLLNGDYDIAVGDFEKAIELDPSYATAYFNLGVAMLCGKNWEKAEENLTRSQNLGFDIGLEFRDEFGSTQEFERVRNIQLPDNILAMLSTQG